MDYLKRENCRSVFQLSNTDVLCECSQRIFMRKKRKRETIYHSSSNAWNIYWAIGRIGLD